MKIFKLFILLILIGSSLSIKAQTTNPLEITQGGISVFGVSPNPETTITSWSFAGNNFSTVSTSTPTQIRTLPSFFTDRQTVNYTFVVEPSFQTRGDIYYNGAGLVNFALAFEGAPIPTRFEITLGNFRIHKVPKTGSPETVEIVVPFTVTGRVCAFRLDPTPVTTLPVYGSGRARLIFNRLNSGGRRVQLKYASFAFGNQTP